MTTHSHVCGLLSETVTEFEVIADVVMALSYGGGPFSYGLFCGLLSETVTEFEVLANTTLVCLRWLWQSILAKTLVLNLMESKVRPKTKARPVD